MSMNNPNANRDDRRPAAAPAWRKWLPWILGALALLILFGLLRSCGDREVADTEIAATPGAAPGSPPPMPATTTTTTVAGAPQAVALPGGAAIQGVPGGLAYDLARYLGSTEAANRRFTFDNLHFDTGAATLRPDSQATLSTVAQILTAYPRAAVRIEGFTDERGDAAANKQLSEERAAAVARALTAAGVPAARIRSAGLGEQPTGAAGAQSLAQNRRTDLVVTAK
ncbi:MAG TPA: OmpA family protein [Caulobacteraceae bacterium]|nr:OmpA family protein [Caulobacteraceae bacterium]